MIYFKQKIKCGVAGSIPDKGEREMGTELYLDLHLEKIMVIPDVKKMELKSFSKSSSFIAPYALINTAFVRTQKL